MIKLNILNLKNFLNVVNACAGRIKTVCDFIIKGLGISAGPTLLYGTEIKSGGILCITKQVIFWKPQTATR